MTRGKLLVALAIVSVVGGAAWAARGGLARWSTPAAEVPTFTVIAGPFRRTVTAEGALKPVQATMLTAPSTGRGGFFISWMAEDGAAVKKGAVVIRFDATEAARFLADGQDEGKAADQRIARERQQIDGALAERDRSATMTKEELARAKELGKKDPRYFPRNEVIESEIDESLYLTRLSKTEAARGVEQRLAKSRIDLLDVDRKRADVTTRQALAALRSLEVRAPHDGTFVVQRHHQRLIQIGDRAWPGMRVAEVARNDRMDAEIFVLEADAGGLGKGKRAEIVLEARPDVVWNARVKAVDPFPKPRRFDVPAQYFGAILEIEGDTSGLKPGQGLEATIVLDEQETALAVPRQAVFTKDDEPFVWRRGAGGAFAPARVQLGAGTVGRLVVERGLDPGDRIALRDPHRSADDMVAGAGENAGGRAASGRAPASGASALVDPSGGRTR